MSDFGMIVFAFCIFVISFYGFWRAGIVQATGTLLSDGRVYIPVLFITSCTIFGFGLRETLNHGDVTATRLRHCEIGHITKILEEAKKAGADGDQARQMIDNYAQQINKENEELIAVTKDKPELLEVPEVYHFLPLSFAIAFMCAGVGGIISSVVLLILYSRE